MSGTPEELFSLPQETTEPGLDFFYSSWQARALVADFIQSLQYLDNARAISLELFIERDQESHRKYIEEHRDEILADLAQKNIQGEEAEAALNDPARFVRMVLRDTRNAEKVLGDHLPFLLQTLIARAYDAFYLYAEDLLRLIYKTRLDQIDLGEEDLDSLIHELVNQHTSNLTRSGQRDKLYKELRERLGLPWLLIDEDKRRETLIVQIRHIITHNRAMINQGFVDRVKSFTKYTAQDLGKLIDLTPMGVSADLDFLHQVVKQVDAVAIAKFGLPHLPIPAMEPSEESTTAGEIEAAQ